MCFVYHVSRSCWRIERDSWSKSWDIVLDSYWFYVCVSKSYSRDIVEDHILLLLVWVLCLQVYSLNTSKGETSAMNPHTNIYLELIRSYKQSLLVIIRNFTSTLSNKRVVTFWNPAPQPGFLDFPTPPRPTVGSAMTLHQNGSVFIWCPWCRISTLINDTNKFPAKFWPIQKRTFF